MRKEEISLIRRMVRGYYDGVYSRAEELETSMPVYEYIDVPSIFFGRQRIYVYNGMEMRAPAGIRDELMHIEKELRYWSNVSPEEES